jgi:hypothetical protein
MSIRKSTIDGLNFLPQGKNIALGRAPAFLIWSLSECQKCFGVTGGATASNPALRAVCSCDNPLSFRNNFPSADGFDMCKKRRNNGYKNNLDVSGKRQFISQQP